MGLGGGRPAGTEGYIVSAYGVLRGTNAVLLYCTMRAQSYTVLFEWGTLMYERYTVLHECCTVLYEGRGVLYGRRAAMCERFAVLCERCSVP